MPELSRNTFHIPMAIMLAIGANAAPAWADQGAGEPETRKARIAEQVEHRFEQRGERINRRLDRAAEHARAAGRPGLAERLDRRGNRIERRMHRRSERIEHRLQRPHPRLKRPHRSHRPSRHR